jgi:hypothetical protein
MTQMRRIYTDFKKNNFFIRVIRVPFITHQKERKMLIL